MEGAAFSKNVRRRRPALAAGSLNPQRSLCVFECRVSQTRPGARPQRSEVSPGGWDAVVASFFPRSASGARAQRDTALYVREAFQVA